MMSIKTRKVDPSERKGLGSGGYSWGFYYICKVFSLKKERSEANMAKSQDMIELESRYINLLSSILVCLKYFIMKQNT